MKTKGFIIKSSSTSVMVLIQDLMEEIEPEFVDE